MANQHQLEVGLTDQEKTIPTPCGDNQLSPY